MSIGKLSTEVQAAQYALKPPPGATKRDLAALVDVRIHPVGFRELRNEIAQNSGVMWKPHEEVYPRGAVGRICGSLVFLDESLPELDAVIVVASVVVQRVKLDAVHA